ncbi:hypothetical protein [Leptospira neocaledonica]|uniref:Porin n=1 Tax=Leptospira neocaledonica TaxID=2023192 RepID=A0A2M9ZVB1_9LEPT|nr:hypothetical protein [Leptospira neocaledonica]PJZ75893.1 hypothetical protein CH365_16115 [Leptospira neocaledonica]
MLKRIFGILLVILSYSEAFAQVPPTSSADPIPVSEKRRSTYFKVTADAVNSATTRNALLIENALFSNRFGQGKSVHFDPVANPTYRGAGIEWGMTIKHASGFFRSNILVAASALSASQAQNNVSNQVGGFFAENSVTNYYFSDNKLATARVGYYGDFLPFHNTNNSFLEKIGIRVGLEAYGNQIDLGSSLNNKSGSFSTFSPSKPGIDFFTSEKIKYSESTLNAVIGLNYEIEFAKKHKINLGVEHFQSVYGNGNYENKTSGINSFGGGMIIPTSTKIHGEVTNKINGNRLFLGYAYSFTETFSIRFTYGLTKAIHEVIDSQVKDKPNAAAIVLGTGDASSLLYSMANPMSANPRSVDSRNQFGLAFEFKF